jgi:hypothetical protein
MDQCALVTAGSNNIERPTQPTHTLFQIAPNIERALTVLLQCQAQILTRYRRTSRSFPRRTSMLTSRHLRLLMTSKM